MNYIVRGDDGIWTFYLNAYKTAKFFDFKRLIQTCIVQQLSTVYIHQHSTNPLSRTRQI